MKAYKVVLASLITIAVLVIFYIISLSNPQPVTIKAQTGKFTMIHTANFVHSGEESVPLFEVRVVGPKAPGTFHVFLMYKFSMKGHADSTIQFIKTEMLLGDGAIDDYDLWLSPYPRGKKLKYYMQVEDMDGNILAVLPENANSSGELLPFRFEGIAPTWVVVLYDIFISVTLLSATLAFFSAIDLKKHPKAVMLLAKQAFWSTIFLLLGGVAFSILLTRKVHGGLGWGGWPIGEFNFTDTNTELVLLYWIILTILLKGSAFAGTESGNLVSNAFARIFTIIGYLLMLTIYLIPHSV